MWRIRFGCNGGPYEGLALNLKKGSSDKATTNLYRYEGFSWSMELFSTVMLVFNWLYDGKSPLKIYRFRGMRCTFKQAFLNLYLGKWSNLTHILLRVVRPLLRDTLPETSSSLLKIGLLKRNFHLPTIDFQGLLLLLSGRVNQCRNPWK